MPAPVEETVTVEDAANYSSKTGRRLDENGHPPLGLPEAQAMASKRTSPLTEDELAAERLRVADWCGLYYAPLPDGERRVWILMPPTVGSRSIHDYGYAFDLPSALGPWPTTCSAQDFWLELTSAQRRAIARQVVEDGRG